MRTHTRRPVFALLLVLLSGAFCALSTPARAAAEPASFAGEWIATTDDARYNMKLQQVGNTVIGTFSPNNGTLEGVVKDNILLFKWTTGGGKGSGRFVMDKAQMAFNGTWTLSGDPQQADGFWNGTRAPTSFAGIWRVSTNVDILSPLLFKLKQNGTRVTGEYSVENAANSPTLSVRAGVAALNTLRFVATDAKGKIVGDGEFVMNEDGKSFTGHIRGNPVTGTFISANP